MITQIVGGVAFILEVLGKWEIGNRKKCGFVLKAVGSVAWLTTGLLIGVHGLTFAAALGFALNVRNYLKWRKNERV